MLHEGESRKENDMKKLYYLIQNKLARIAFEFNLEQAGYPIRGRTLEAMDDMNYYYSKYMNELKVNKAKAERI